ncbi:MAG TPA: hypothetical protein VJY62_02325 [Bacteroidia bacterium]|nr:hypothetical protein [Bacteroidia bacterium]
MKKILKISIGFILLLSSSCKREDIDSCERDLTGQYCIEQGRKYETTISFTVKDYYTGNPVVPSESFDGEKGDQKCVDIPIIPPSTSRVIKVSYTISGTTVEITDTLEICEVRTIIVI